jgi:4'-phosphopantetheinyl transferase
VELCDWPHESDLRTLCEQERQRAGRFVFDADRRRYLAAHCALRGILSRHTGHDSSSLEYDAGPHGKPSLSGISGCQFNLSHGHDVALVAVSDNHALGVDVEVLRLVEDAAELAQIHFTAAEQAEFRAAPAHERDRLFLVGWTRKEACLKAIGSGLSLPARVVEAGLASRPRDLSVDTACGRVALRVRTLDAGSDVVAALACVVEPTS